MAQRKHKHRDSRIPRHGKVANAESARDQTAIERSESEPNLSGRPKNAKEKRNFQWVAVEHRDADGNPTFPRKLIATTMQRRYSEVPPGSEIKVSVLAGYTPKALMLVERKIYEIHRQSVRGWRGIGQIAVELDGWRQHEADWFKAMRGARLNISDPGLPGPHNDSSDYVISNSSFEPKLIKLAGANNATTEVRVFEGTLDISETWRSAVRRRSAEILNLSFKVLIAPLLVALGAGLTLFWVGGLPNSDSQDLIGQSIPRVESVQALKDDTVSEPSDTEVTPLLQREPVHQSANTKQDSGKSELNSHRSTEDRDKASADK